MVTEKMKPCPFCGSPAVHDMIENDERLTASVKCTNEKCGCHVAPYDGKSRDAAIAWNRRAQADFDARIRSALSAQVQDVAVPEGWTELSPSYHNDPYHVEKIMGIWHLRFKNPNGSALTISKHDTAKEALAAVPAAHAPKLEENP